MLPDSLKNLLKILENENIQAYNELKRLLDSGVSNISTLYRYLIKKQQKNLKSIFIDIINEVGAMNFYLINIDAGVDQKPRELEDVSDILSIGRLPKNLFLIAIKKSLFNRYMGTKKVLDNIIDFDSKWLIATLASDNDNIFWHKLEEFLIREYYFRPPLNDLLPIFHAAKESTDKIKALEIIEMQIRSRGILIREWKRIGKIIEQIEEFVKSVKFEDNTSAVIKGIIALIKGKINFMEFFSILISLSKISINEKVDILLSYGCRPSLESITHVNIEKEGENYIIRSLRKAQRRFEPEFSIQEIFGIKRPSSISPYLLYLWLEGIISKALEEIYNGKIKTGDNIRLLLKLSIALSLSNVEIKSMEKSLIIRYLLSLGRRILDAPISLTSLLIQSVRHLKNKELSASLVIQRFLEVHGADVYFYLLDKLIPQEKLLDALVIQIVFSSDIGILPQKVIAHSLNKEDLLSRINYLLTIEKIRPKGITVGIPWELKNIKIEEIASHVKRASQYFKNAGVEYPDSLKTLIQVLKGYESIKQLDKRVKLNDLPILAKTIKDVSVVKDNTEKLQNLMRLAYGVETIHFFSNIVRETNTVLGRLREEWEKNMLRNFPTFLKEKRNVPLTADILSIIKKKYKDYPIVLVVIDGLRIDDFQSKLKPTLVRMGLKPLEDNIAISLLPSITSVSRRSIFGGLESVQCLSNVPRAIGCELQREDELLRKNLDPEATYVFGPFGSVINYLSNLGFKVKKLRTLAIVLSELEKTSHGATEAFLAKISTDYARGIARVIKVASKISKMINREKPIVIITADHGLEAFTKFVNVPLEEIISALKRKGFLEIIHEPEFKERYAILPISSPEHAQSTISLVEVMTKGQVTGILASELGYKKVALRLKVEGLYDSISSNKAIILFPRGNRKFLYRGLKKNKVVFHGGVSPAEMIVPFSIFRG